MASALVSLALSLTLGQGLGASPMPVGEPFEVNTYTTGDQSSAQVTFAPDGTFFVAWNSSSSPETDTSGTSILGQRFEESGQRSGAEFQINTLTSGNQSLGNLKTLPNGDIVVVWSSEESAGADTDQSIQGKILFSTGGDSGDFQVNADGLGLQRLPRVDADAEGDFVVTWLDPELQGQRFSSEGVAVGAEFQIDPSPGSAVILDHDVGLLADGRFAVFWMQSIEDRSEVWARRYTADGDPVGVDLQVGSIDRSSPAPRALDVAVADGDFHVAWTAVSIDFPASPVQARSFRGHDLTPLYPTVELDQFFSITRRVAIGAEKGGGLVVAWDREPNLFGGASPDGSGSAILARALRSDGSILGDELIVNTFTAGDQTHPALGFDDRGGLLVLWTSSQSDGLDTDGTSIQAQRFLGGNIIFADNFETGDLTRWSLISP